MNEQPPLNTELTIGSQTLPETLDWSSFKDPYIKGQTMALISICGPTCAQKADTYGVAIRGVAGSQEALDLIKDKVYQKNKLFDLYQVPVGELIPLDFSERDLGADYAEERLNVLMKDLHANYEKGREEFDRHREMLKSGKRDPKDLEILMNSIHERRKELDEEEGLVKEAMESLVGDTKSSIKLIE